MWHNTKKIELSAPPPSIQVNYSVGRTMIKTGDIINFFESHEETLLHRFITGAVLFFTGSRIYHTGVAIWVNPDGETRPRLMLLEAVGVGRRMVNMSNFKDKKMEIHSLPETVDKRIVMDYMLDGIGTPYGVFQLAKIAFTEFFGAKPSKLKRGQVCSEVAAIAWQLGGFKFETTALSPGRLRNYLSAHGVPPAFIINPDAGD